MGVHSTGVQWPAPPQGPHLLICGSPSSGKYARKWPGFRLTTRQSDRKSSATCSLTHEQRQMCTGAVRDGPWHLALPLFIGAALLR
jgi:hypothetical protein